VVLGGTLRDPDIQLESDVGEQISEGVKFAFTQQLDVAKERLVAEVNTFAGEQIEKLTGRFKGEYDELMTKNRDLLEQIGEVQEIVATLRSGKVDPQALVRQVANSKLIPTKDQEKIRKIAEDVDQALNGHMLPAGLQKKLEGLPITIPNLPPNMSNVHSLFPQFQPVGPQLPKELQQLPLSVQQLQGPLRSLIPKPKTASREKQPGRSLE
jgi:hypothetical protein